MMTQKFKLCLVTRQLYEDDNVLTEIISIIVNFTNEKDSNFKFGTDLSKSVPFQNAVVYPSTGPSEGLKIRVCQ